MESFVGETCLSKLSLATMDNMDNHSYRYEKKLDNGTLALGSSMNLMFLFTFLLSQEMIFIQTFELDIMS